MPGMSRIGPSWRTRAVELRLRRLDVVDSEGQRRAALAARFLALREADIDPLHARLQLAPGNVVRPVEQLKPSSPHTRRSAVEVGHAQRAGQPAVIVRSPCASSRSYALFLYHIYFSSMYSRRMIAEDDLRWLTAGRWLVPLLALASREEGSRFAVMLARLGLSRAMLGESSTGCSASGWLIAQSRPWPPASPGICADRGGPAGRRLVRAGDGRAPAARPRARQRSPLVAARGRPARPALGAILGAARRSCARSALVRCRLR